MRGLHGLLTERKVTGHACRELMNEPRASCDIFHRNASCEAGVQQTIDVTPELEHQPHLMLYMLKRL